MQVRDSALKHGYDIENISHAIDMALLEKEIDPDNDPPKILFIGPDHAGNLLAATVSGNAGWTARPA